MNILKKLIDINDPDSITTKVRQENFKIFKSFVSLYNKPVKILDLGGTQEYWKMMEYTDPNLIQVTLINLDDIKVTLPNFNFIKIDVLDIKDIDCDIIFSHSMIEHLDNKEKFAKIIKDSGKSYFIQTPNKYFPIEPHFLIPLFQFFPKWLKFWCTKIFRKELLPEVESINLLSNGDLKKLFPDATISSVKIFGLTQSFVVSKTNRF